MLLPPNRSHKLRPSDIKILLNLDVVGVVHVFVCALNIVEAIFLRGSARRVVSFRPFVRRRCRCPPLSLCAPDLPSMPTILVRRPYYLVSFPSTVLRPSARSTPFCLSFSTLTFWFDLWSRLAVSVVQPLPQSPLSPRRYSCLSSAPSSALMFVLPSFVPVLPLFIVFSDDLRNLFYVLKILFNIRDSG